MGAMRLARDLDRIARRRQMRVTRARTTDGDIRSALLAELQYLNEQIAWQNRAILHLLERQATDTKRRV